MIARPNNDEYAPFYAGYIARVPDGIDLLELLKSQPAELRNLLSAVDESHASMRPAPTEWSIKEVLGHIADTERVFAYRAMRIARNDTTPLPGFEQNDYVEATRFNARTVAGLLDEFEAQRRSNVILIAALTDAEIARRGTASGGPVSVRGLLYMMAGHVAHHVESLKTDYHVSG